MDGKKLIWSNFLSGFKGAMLGLTYTCRDRQQWIAYRKAGFEFKILSGQLEVMHNRGNGSSKELDLVIFL